MVNKLSLPSMLKRAVSQFLIKPTADRYPYVKPQLSENFRGQHLFDFALCVGCGLCSRDCPTRSIEMVSVDGKKRPQFRLDKCIFCYQCAETCRKKAIKNSTFYELATADKSSLIIKPKPIINII